ncbi:hypothetical protein SAY87_014567 [Trapa incisa]|uniref:NAC domain-containing protein n=2 Tax=Trapa TaxID=22665 RepID=A0AAN7MUA4_TRANT|nr:hypothetical protein SAY87_014567 [Trapa incisa]KAK4802195.1 hypothetical protein SAY86_000398 [Trapa natans]
MPSDMNLSINGQSQVPPGFRFHPTEEELLHYYLRKKVALEKIDLDVIREVDLNKLEPWDIQDKCRIGSTPQNDWYFFSHKDKKYPTGTRTNRATAAGFWKATGRDKIIYAGCNRIGLRKTLVFYKGRAPRGQKSDWIMHEYRLDDGNQEQNDLASSIDMNVPEEGWVICRVFKKKNYQKAFDSPRSSSTTAASLLDAKIQFLCSSGSHASVLDQILSYMGRSTAACKVESIFNEASLSLKDSENTNNNSVGDASESSISGTNKYRQQRFMHLPRLENTVVPPTIAGHPPQFDNCRTLEEIMLIEPAVAPSSGAATPANSEPVVEPARLVDWAALDRLVASQLDSHTAPADPCRPASFLGGDQDDLPLLQQPARMNRLTDCESMQETLGCEGSPFWTSFMAKSSWSSSSSSDPLRHLSL